MPAQLGTTTTLGPLRGYDDHDEPLSDERSTKPKTPNRFFRLMSPKKAMARKAQARMNARRGIETTAAAPGLTPESMDAIGILPLASSGDSSRGRVIVRRGNIVASNQAMEEIGKVAEATAAGCLTDGDNSIVANDKPHPESTLPHRSTHTAPRVPPERAYSPKSRSPRQSHLSPPTRTTSNSGVHAGMDHGNLLNGHYNETPTHEGRHEYTPHRDRAPQPLALEQTRTELIRTASHQIAPTRNPRIPLDVALEQTRTELIRTTSHQIAPTRDPRIPLDVVHDTQNWTTRASRKAKPVVISEERVEPRRYVRSSAGMTPDPAPQERWQEEENVHEVEENRRREEEERRQTEDEQENQLILLAMELSLADAAEEKKHWEQLISPPVRHETSAPRYPYLHNENPTRTSQGDEDEVASREEEMIRRAVEMSMQDF